jgi:adenylate cyclase
MKTAPGAQQASAWAPHSEAFRLGDVEVMPASGKVRGPEGVRKLDPKVMEVLSRLAAAGGEVVSRETLMADVWGDIVVTDFALSRCVYQLRKNLGGVSAKHESPVETLPKRGYRLVWPLTGPGPEPAIERNQPWRPWLAGLGLILATAAAVFWPRPFTVSQPTDRPAIAVMPFRDLTADGTLEHFGEGLAQTLLTELGHVRELDVIARSSSFGLRGSDISPENIVRSLGVRYLVEGSVNRESDTLRVSAALTDAGNGRQLWSQEFQAVAGQLFSVQRDLATEIAAYLQVSLGNPRDHGGTESYEAFEAYLRATETDDPQLATVFIDEALAHDPNFALALVAKAQLSYVRLWQGIGTAEGAWEEARPVLEGALSITDELPDAYVQIGGFQMMREDYEAAEPALRRALEINPSHDEAHAHLSRLMARTGRANEAVALAQRNVRLDPLNSKRHEQLANRLWTAGDIQGGTASFERALELDPFNHSAWGAYAHRLGDLESPLEAFRLVARLQQNPQFRSLFFGPVPRIPPAGVQVFGLWFGFIEDFAREREMLKLQSEMADNARLHRELAWALIGEGDLDSARNEAWVGLGGMPRETIANFQVAYIALQTGQGLDDVLDHYRAQWPGIFESPPRLDSLPEELAIGVALIHREQGHEQRAVRLLHMLQQDGEDPFAATAMALAHLGNIDQAVAALKEHIDSGGYFNYLPGDPFWAPLAGDARFLAILQTHHEKAAAYRAEVQAMIDRGELVLPGQLEFHASLQND